MSNRRSLAILAVFTLAACTPTPEGAAAQQGAAAKPAVASTPAPALDQHDYTPFGMPDPSKAWSVKDYSAAHGALNAIARQDRKLLPRVGSATFAKLTHLDQLAQLAGSAAPEDLASLSLALGMAQMIYGDQVRREPSFEREHLIVSAAVIRVTTKLPATMVRNPAEAVALRGQPARLKGLLEFRHGIYELVLAVLEPASASELPRSFACEQLSLVIDEAAPLLLGDERGVVRAHVRDCASAGASAEAIERLDRALADDARTAALVTALLDEHREFAARKIID